MKKTTLSLMLLIVGAANTLQASDPKTQTTPHALTATTAKAVTADSVLNNSTASTNGSTLAPSTTPQSVSSTKSSTATSSSQAPDSSSFAQAKPVKCVHPIVGHDKDGKPIWVPRFAVILSRAH